MNIEAKKKMVQARSNLLLDQPFFGSLALRLELTEDLACQTCWTDGKRLGYNPDYILSKTETKIDMPECMALVAEETMHNSNGHSWRRPPGVAPDEWNICCDLALMPILVKAGMRIPSDSC